MLDTYKELLKYLLSEILLQGCWVFVLSLASFLTFVQYSVFYPKARDEVVVILIIQVKQQRHEKVIAKPECRRTRVSRTFSPLAGAVSPGTLFFCHGEVMCVLFGNVYTREVGAIVCWWRLEIHKRVSGECHCRSSPQLAIVGPGAVTGWVVSPVWLVLCVKIPLSASDRGKGE